MFTRFHLNYRLLGCVVCCLAAIFIMACNGTEVGNPDNIDLSLSGDVTGFSDNEELEAYLKTQYSQSVYSDYPYGLEDTAGRNDDAVDEDFDAGSGAGNGGPEAPVADGSRDYTDTNIQEAGVDEADVVKTDGEILYVAGSRSTGNADKVYLASVTSPMSLLSTIQVKGSVIDMYLYDHLLVILYQPLNYEGLDWINSGTTDIAFIGIPYWIPIQSKTGVAVYDISDPDSPLEKKTFEIDGYLVSSRRIQNKLYVIQQYLPNLPSPYELEDRINAMTIEDLVPFYADVTGLNSGGSRTQLIAPEDFYRPDIDGGGSIVSVVTIDLDNLDNDLSSTGLVGDASIVYASTQSIYITSTYWYYDTVDNNEPVQQTLIYKFDLTGDQVRGQGYVTVTGRVLNQFSLGEYENVLRIATTTGWTGGVEPTSKNHVYCIGQKEGRPAVIGSLKDMAPGEEIYAARFLGTRGFLVTFVTIDPLFTLDLSDPTDPKIVGELKVPGYSEYIHPVGENHLLTIGKDAQEDGRGAWYQGVQLTIFDISDFSDPQLLHSEKIGDRGTHSDALYNHKAFTFWEENGWLAIPIDLYEHQSLPTEPWQWGSMTFKGLYVYQVDLNTGFELLGRIPTLLDLGAYWNRYGSFTRGVFIDEQVYAVTPDAVRSAQVSDIENTIEFLSIE